MIEATTPSREDVQYVRQLSESGAHAPLLNGRFMAWWGLLVTVAWTAQHFAVRGEIGDGDTIFGIIWSIFGIVGTIGQVALARSMPPKPGAGSAGNRAARWVWAAGAFAILSMVIGVAVLARSPMGYATFDWIVPVAFAVYACALIVTGSLARSAVILVAGAGAILMVGLFTALILSEARYLVAAAGVFLTVFLPGVLTLRAEPR